MHGLVLKAAGLSLTLGLFCLPSPLWANCLAVVHPKKESPLKGTAIPGDFTKNEASITLHFAGSGPNIQPQNFDPAPTTFVLGTGKAGSIFGSLAGQGQVSSWNIVGHFNDGRTIFSDTTGANVGFFGAGACLNAKPGNSEASTTFKVAGGFNGGTTKITAGDAKDDAFLESDVDTVSLAGGRLRFALDGTTALGVETLLQARLGAKASIVGEGPGAGLTLLAAPGQSAAFSVVATNALNPGESFSWSATFNGSGRPSTIASGISDPSSFFMPTAGGWFLPFDAMPAHDLTANLGSGQLEFMGIASAAVAAIPEPGTPALLGMGLLGLLVCTWQRSGAAARTRSARSAPSCKPGREAHGQVELGHDEQALPAVADSCGPGQAAAGVLDLPRPPTMTVTHGPFADGDARLQRRGHPGRRQHLAALRCWQRSGLERRTSDHA